MCLDSDLNYVRDPSSSCEGWNTDFLFYSSSQLASRLVLLCLKPLGVRIVRLMEETLVPGTLCRVVLCICIGAPHSLFVTRVLITITSFMFRQHVYAVRKNYSTES